MIRIEVPATSANLGSGFDALGIALNKYNRVWMEEWDSVEISSVDNTKIPTDTSNLIFWAANYLYESCGHKLPGLKILQENNIPMARDWAAARPVLWPAFWVQTGCWATLCLRRI